jgi:hypothetical protein
LLRGPCELTKEEPFQQPLWEVWNLPDYRILSVGSPPEEFVRQFAWKTGRYRIGVGEVLGTGTTETPSSTFRHGLSSDFLGGFNESTTYWQKKEADAVKISIERNRPLGAEDWVQSTAKHLGLESTIRNRGRPKKIEWFQYLAPAPLR